MADIKLSDTGSNVWDIDITEDGDIQLVESAPQTIRIMLQWINGEWRLGPDLGFPWFEDVWVKNPNLNLIKQDILSTIRSVKGVTDASVEILEYDPRQRRIRFKFKCRVNDEDFTEEVTLYG